MKGQMDMEKLVGRCRESYYEALWKDSLIALATVEEGIPHVRTVDGYYDNGAFYVLTYALSNKMEQIAKNPIVAISGEWFMAHGTGSNLG